MKKKQYIQSSQAQALLQLKDMAASMEQGDLPLDDRVQVKMPSVVVEALDASRGEISRSELLTRIALEYLIERKRFVDRPDLHDIKLAEQSMLDRAVDYLEERDA